MQTLSKIEGLKMNMIKLIFYFEISKQIVLDAILMYFLCFSILNSFVVSELTGDNEVLSDLNDKVKGKSKIEFLRVKRSWIGHLQTNKNLQQ